MHSHLKYDYCPSFVFASSFNNNLHHMLVQRSFENNPISFKTFNLQNQYLILFDTFLLYFLMTLFVLNLAFKCFSRHFILQRYIFKFMRWCSGRTSSNYRLCTDPKYSNQHKKRKKEDLDRKDQRSSFHYLVQIVWQGPPWSNQVLKRWIDWPITRVW